MIDPEWLLEDLDPRTWRAIGHLFTPAQYVAASRRGEHGLFVLHGAASAPRVVDTACGVRQDLDIASVSDPRSLAAELYARGEWDRVHVIDRRHLEHVAAASACAQPRLSVDAHYRRVYQLLWDGSDGYVCEPPRAADWHGWTYSALHQFLSQVASPSALGLVVLAENSAVHISLALEVRAARVCRVTTLEGLPQLPPPTVSEPFLDAFWSALHQALAPPAAALVCSRATFEAWLYASANKPAVLQTAVQDGQAVLRLTV
jgi:hypothetical protein